MQQANDRSDSLHDDLEQLDQRLNQQRQNVARLEQEREHIVTQLDILQSQYTENRSNQEHNKECAQMHRENKRRYENDLTRIDKELAQHEANYVQLHRQAETKLRDIERLKPKDIDKGRTLRR